ncbi:hypothetical protein [Enterococcus faecalis]|uniref:hypothetical protein n=1 Tax=Enterococcus faecalis TaxID=1351 RepID=UPI00157269D6|nr:hypothetical protein [Enterococcus faecalis]NSV77513.1 hypothetical protein [Enterococcus faecalis]
MAIKGRSKFDFEVFNGDFNNWMGFNKQKYTREQAIEEWRSELMLEENTLDKCQ